MERSRFFAKVEQRPAESITFDQIRGRIMTPSVDLEQWDQLHPLTLSPWWYLAERRSVAMSEEERAVVLDRFIRSDQLNIASEIIIED